MEDVHERGMEVRTMVVMIPAASVAAYGEIVMPPADAVAVLGMRESLRKASMSLRVICFGLFGGNY